MPRRISGLPVRFMGDYKAVADVADEMLEEWSASRLASAEEEGDTS